MDETTAFVGPLGNRWAGEEKRFFSFRGFMKSGTNWVGQLLNLHPEINCVGELHFQTCYQTIQSDMRNLSIMENRRLEPMDHGTCRQHGAEVRRVVRENLEAMFRQTLLDLAQPAAKVIGDRTPHTLNPLIFKDAPQITLIRDARDVLVSRIHHLFNYPTVSRVFQRFPSLQPKLAAFQENPWYFREHPAELLTEETLVRESLRWWREHLESDRNTQATHPNLRVLTLKYEDVHRDVEAKRHQMYRFLEVDPGLAHPIPPALTPGFKQERPRSFNRKGQVGDWRNYVFDGTKEWIKDEVGQELIRQGYESSLDW